MTTFTWNFSMPGSPSNWGTASDWLPVEVPNAPDAVVVVPLITAGDQPFVSDITIDAGASYVIDSLDITDAVLALAGTLSIGGGLTMRSGSVIDVNGSLELGSLDNTDGVEIEGAGELSSPNSIVSTGEITGNGLTLAVAGLQNDGTLIAAGLLEVYVAGGTAAFGNLVGGTLTGGTYEAFNGGTLLLLMPATVTSDAANIVIGAQTATSNTTGVIETTGGNIEQTLQTITAAGSLTLNGGVFQTTNTLLDQGSVIIVQATLAPAALTIDAGGTLAGGGTIAAPLTNDGLVLAAAEPGGFVVPGQLSAADLVISGAVAGTGSFAIGPSFGFEAIHGDEPQTLEFAGAVAENVTFQDDDGVLILDDATHFTGAISGFQAGEDLHQFFFANVSDTIILPGMSLGAITHRQYNPGAGGGTLVLQEASGSIALQFSGSYDLGSFVIAAGPQALSTSPPSVEITEVLPCFAAGTHILTASGEVPVEALRIGDSLPTLHGTVSRLHWLGHRHVDCARHKCPHDVWPIRVQTGAFAENTPHRDLFLSPDHAVWIDGSLIPIRYLVNGTTIAQQPVDEVTYWHVELTRHDVILAEGLPCESYLDTGNREAFAEAGRQDWALPRPARARPWTLS